MSKQVLTLFLIFSLIAPGTSVGQQDTNRDVLQETGEAEGRAYGSFLLAIGFVAKALKGNGNESSKAFTESADALIKAKISSTERVRKFTDAIREQQKREGRSGDKGEEWLQKDAYCSIADLYEGLATESKTGSEFLSAGKQGIEGAFTQAMSEATRGKWEKRAAKMRNKSTPSGGNHEKEKEAMKDGYTLIKYDRIMWMESGSDKVTSRYLVNGSIILKKGKFISKAGIPIHEDSNPKWNDDNKAGAIEWRSFKYIGGEVKEQQKEWATGKLILLSNKIKFKNRLTEIISKSLPTSLPYEESEEEVDDKDESEYYVRTKKARRFRSDHFRKAFASMKGNIIKLKRIDKEGGFIGRKSRSTKVSAEAGTIKDDDTGWELQYGNVPQELTDMLGHAEIRAAVFGYYFNKAEEFSKESIDTFVRLYEPRGREYRRLCNKVDSLKDDVTVNLKRVVVANPRDYEIDIEHPQFNVCLADGSGDIPKPDSDCDCKADNSCAKGANHRHVRIQSAYPVINANYKDIKAMNDAISNGKIGQATALTSDIKKRAAALTNIRRKVSKPFDKKHNLKEAQKFGELYGAELDRSIARATSNMPEGDLSGASGGIMSSSSMPHGIADFYEPEGGDGEEVTDLIESELGVYKGGRAIAGKESASYEDMLDEEDGDSTIEGAAQKGGRATSGYEYDDHKRDSDVYGSIHGDQVNSDADALIWDIITERYKRSYYHQIFKRKSPKK